MRGRARTARTWVTSPGNAGHDRARPRSRSRGTGWAPRGWATIRATSVCDPWQRLWDVDNVVVADSSVFPTSSGYGPTLTIVALAIRAARVLAASM